MATTLKKCLRLYKLFKAEVARSSRLESEGSQVLSSLANISLRLPLLLQSANSNSTDTVGVDGDTNVMGVLRYSTNTQALLLQKHFLALEKSREFLIAIMRDFHELVRHLRSITSDCVTLVDDALIEAESAGSRENECAMLTFPLKLHEWMENVLVMYEHENVRKVELVADLEYSDPERLSTVHKQWSATGAMGNIDNDYVQSGLEVPQIETSAGLQPGSSESHVMESKSKSKKKKKRARN